MIRPIIETDIASLFELGLEKHQESDSNDLTLSADKFINLCWQIMGSPYKLGIVNEENGILTGMLFADITSPQWSTDIIAEEYVFIVSKAHRGGSSAARLIKYYTEWAKRHNVKKIYLSANSGHKTEKLASFYERKGFRMQGYNFVMEV